MTVPIASHYASTAVHHNVVSDVELSVVVEERSVYVGLDDVS